MLFIKRSYKSLYYNISKINLDKIKYFSSSTKPIAISNVHSSNLYDNVLVEGWITGMRKLKELIFIDVMDGSCAEKLQVTLEKSKAPTGINFGSTIKVSGSLQKNKTDQFEVIVDDIEIIGDCVSGEGYPFTQRMPYNPKHERLFLHLRPRTKTFSSLLRIRHKSELFLHNLLDELEFFNVDVPMLTTNDCENSGEVFTVIPDNDDLIKQMIKESTSKNNLKIDTVFFNNKTHLTVSGQLHLEAAARSLKKVYRFGPTFRAENSKSRLHLSEFYMLETESAFVNDIHDVNSTIETIIKKLVDRILSSYGAELHSYLQLTDVNVNEHLDMLNKIANEKFITITYDEAFDMVNKNKDSFKSLPRQGQPFGKEHELYLVDCCDGIPVFVVDWPEECKPFYTKSLPGSDKVESVDLLCSNVGELCGGGVREDDYDRLKLKSSKSHPGSSLDWYLQLRKYGNVTTGGFGMGFERFLQLLLGIPNIKDTIPFPRWPHNCKL